MNKQLLLLSVFIFSSSISFGQTYVINSIAGNGTAGFSGDGGSALLAEINYPYGIASDDSGNVYITDTFNNRIRKISSKGIITTIAGGGTKSLGDGGPADSAQINFPTAIAVDDSGLIYIADYNDNRIRKVDRKGIITTYAGTGSQGFTGDGGQAALAELYNPEGVAVDDSGNVFIADRNNARIRKVNKKRIITTIAGNGTGGFSGDGGAATIAEINWPKGVATDDSGSVYIADYNNNRIRKVSAKGIITTIAGNGTAGYSGNGGSALAAEINGPTGVAIDTLGNIYIADYSNHIRKVSRAGIISSIAGNGTTGFSGDGGPATSAMMSSPWSVTVNDSGFIFFPDGGNQRVRKLSPMPTVVNNISNSSETVLFYPNPSNGKFTFQSSVVSRQLLVEVYNVLGEQVYSQYSLPNTQYQIDLSSQPSGVYFYRVLSDNKFVGSGKLIIQ
ncbi:MAG TPA: T9SS type A sorting domain-containing protein [Bacteroidia bacterium]|nr:T9SS type A sorting domain-containing protein [Bacteroidia bacterium]